MSNPVESINILRQRLRELLPASKRMPDDGLELRPGQLWSIRRQYSDDETTWVVMIEELLGDGYFNVVPCFRGMELAGPDDVAIPVRLANSELVASFELEATLNRSALDACRERLSNEAVRHVLDARAAMEHPDKRKRFTWGMAYLGKHGVRQVWHEQINRVLESLQGDVRQWAFDDVGHDGQFGAARPFSVVAPHFKLAEELAQAADSGEEWTSCIYATRDPDTGQERFIFNKERPRAKWIAGHPLKIMPGANKGLCAEWWFEGPPIASQATIYVAKHENPIGTALVVAKPGGLLIQMDCAVLPEGAAPIEKPSALYILLR